MVIRRVGVIEEQKERSQNSRFRTQIDLSGGSILLSNLLVTGGKNPENDFSKKLSKTKCKLVQKNYTNQNQSQLINSTRTLFRDDQVRSSSAGLFSLFCCIRNPPISQSRDSRWCKGARLARPSTRSGVLRQVAAGAAGSTARGRAEGAALCRG